MTSYPIIAFRATTSLGDAPGPLFDRLLRNETGLKSIPKYRFDAGYKNALNARACIIEQTPEFWDRPHKNILRQYVVPFVQELLRAVRGESNWLRPNRIGLCIGTSVGISHELAAMVRSGQSPPPSVGLRGLLCNVCSEVGISGPRSIVSTACTAGATSIIRGIYYLSSGRADLVICGGFDFFSELTHTGFNSLRAMTPTTCRPFDAGREGMILGDGIGLVAIVRGDDKRFAKLPAMAHIAGFATGSDNYHETSPQPSGEVLANLMLRAWKDAGGPALGYVNAHGTATEANDESEIEGLQKFAKAAGQRRILVSSVKGNIGHTLGAAGAVEAIITAITLGQGIVPPNYGLVNPMGTASDIVLVREPEHLAPDASAMSVSLAFGGHIAVLLLKPARNN